MTKTGEGRGARVSRFEEEGKALIHTVASQAKLKVLIWGPGDPGEKAPPEERKGWEKRCLIRTELEKCFPQSEFMFSEEININDEVIDNLTEEGIHADLARLIIVLDISRGTHLELDYFTTHYDWFRSKVYVLAPQRYQSSTGLAMEVLKKIPTGQVRWFTPEEFERCDLAKHLSPKIVSTVAIDDYLHRK